MQVGKRKQGHTGHEKMCCARHTARNAKAVASRCERAIERRVRQEGKRACREERE